MQDDIECLPKTRIVNCREQCSTWTVPVAVPADALECAGRARMRFQCGKKFFLKFCSEAGYIKYFFRT